MAANDHRWHEQLAPYALGLLPEEEAFFLEQHLDSCDQCRAQLRRLREHYALADGSRPTTPTVRPTRRTSREEAPPPSADVRDDGAPVPPVVTAPVASPPAAAVGTAPPAPAPRTDAGGTPQRPVSSGTPAARPAAAATAPAGPVAPMFTAASTRDRIGLVEVAVAVAAAVLFLVGIVTVAARGSAPASEVVQFSAVAEGVTAAAELVAQPWGTAIHLDIDGFVPGMVYVARVRDTDGDLIQAGTFTGTSGQPIAVDLTASVPRDELTEIIVTERGGDIVLVAEL